MTDLERAARAMWEAREDIEAVAGDSANRCPFEAGDPEIMAMSRAVIEAVLLDLSEEAVEAAARGECALHARNSPDHRRSDEDMQKFIDWHWRAHEQGARAALRAAGMRMMMTEADAARLVAYRDFMEHGQPGMVPDVAFFLRLLDEVQAALAAARDRTIEECAQQCHPREGDAWSRGAEWTGDLIEARILALKAAPPTEEITA